VAVGATAVAFLGGNEIVLLLGAGIAVVLLQRGAIRAVAMGVALAAPVPKLAAAVAATTGGVPLGLASLFLFFLKVGSVLFGSGYVLLAFLRADLVDRWGWLSEGQLLDAVAVGQMTPGPVFTTATFIGYLLAGLPGATLATLGIFLPAFVFVAATGPLVPRLRRSPTAGAFLDGVNVASLALLVAVTWYLGRAALVDVPTGALAIVAGLLLVRHRVNSAWLVLGGGLAGLAVHALT
jgi:chromate transporter